MTHTLHPEIENIIKDIRTYVYEYDKFQEVVLRQILEKHLLPTDQNDSEQSIPKIEKIDMTGVDMGQSHFGSDRVLMRLYEKQCEIIDYINNLPTK